MRHLEIRQVKVPESSRICIFLRHGESQNNKSNTLSSGKGDYGLTHGGFVEAGLVADELDRLRRPDNYIASGIANVLTSPIKRAHQTAYVVSDRLDVGEPRADERLRERSYGKYDGKSFSAAVDIHNLRLEEIKRGYPEWESFESMINRVRDFSRGIGNGEVVVAVTHQGIINAAICERLGITSEPAELPKEKYATFTVIDYGKAGQASILAVSRDEFSDRLIEKLAA